MPESDMLLRNRFATWTVAMYYQPLELVWYGDPSLKSTWEEGVIRASS